MSKVHYAFILAAICLLCILPASAAYNYHYNVPYNTLICTEEDSPVDNYYAWWRSNNYVTVASDSFTNALSQPMNTSTYMWSTTQLASYGSQCTIMTPNTTIYITMHNSTNWDFSKGSFYYNMSNPNPAVDSSVDFYANSTSGNPPFSTDFYAQTSIKDDASRVVKWNVTSGPILSSFSPLSDLVATFNAVEPGAYSIKLEIFNTTVNGTKTRNNYIILENPNTTLKTTCFQAYDGITHGAIMGPSIFIYDQQVNNWSNSTDDSDGLHCIVAYEDHLLDGYATKSGYSQGQIWDVFSTGDIYPINLYPSGMLDCPGCGGPGDPGVGNVNLIVNVFDKNNGNQPIGEASVTITPPTGGQRTQLTSSSGAAIFVVPNLSTISVTATKSGYSSISDSITTTVMGPDTISLGLTRFVATPTPTVTNSLGTPVTTVIPGCEDPTSSTCYAARDTEMANDVRDWIEILIPIAGIMTIMYLLGWKP